MRYLLTGYINRTLYINYIPIDLYGTAYGIAPSSPAPGLCFSKIRAQTRRLI